MVRARWSLGFVVGLAIFPSVLSGACSDDEPTAPAKAVQPSGSSIGPAGGSVGNESGIRIDIPPGALTTPTPITIDPAPEAPLPKDGTPVGPAFRFGPEGLTFASPVTVTLGVTHGAVPAGEEPSVFIESAPVSTGVYADLSGTSLGVDQIRATTTHFSYFVPVLKNHADAGTSADSGVPGYSYDNEVDPPLVPTNKVDVLFVVDNSYSMGDKQSVLAGSAASFVKRFIVEKGIKDIHVGVISSSLGTMGGDICANDTSFPRQNDKGHLLNAKKGGGTVANAPNGVLSYTGGDVAALTTDIQDIILGVDQTGCGFEAQLESMYRFLVQPDPWDSVSPDANRHAAYNGIDDTVLAQRKAFLRPDSSLAIVMLTDEDDSNVDPMSIGGQGWVFANRDFPGSTVRRGTTAQGTTAARGTSTCAVNPVDPACTSCGFKDTCDPATASCQAIRNDPNCNDANGGFYGPQDDDLNVRFFRMRSRYGIDPQFPMERYIRGLTNRRAPTRDTEHVVTTSDIGVKSMSAYVHTPTCQSPLFAATLPDPGQDLCNLPASGRSRQLVSFMLLGGVPPALSGKRASEMDWTKVLGRNPDAYDFTGIDPHMIPSVTPRAGLAPPAPKGDNGPDPVHGREWDTQKGDLQYACTFTLPTPRVCTADDQACDCTGDKNPPLCDAASLTTQIKGKAFPTTRELMLAKAMGDRAVVGSVCAFGETGYAPLLDVLFDRMAPTLVAP